MPAYTVHIYREMRVTFTGIEAGSAEAAARLGADLRTHQAAGVEDCDGANLFALVDHEGDADFDESVAVAFEDGRLRDAAPGLMGVLSDLVSFGYGRAAQDFWSDFDRLLDRARRALRKAKGRPPAQS